MHRSSKRLQLAVALLLLLIQPAVVRAACSIVDLTKSPPEDDVAAALATGGEWLNNALVCSVGTYTVATSADRDDSPLYIWTKDGPLLLFQEGLGLNIFGRGPETRSSEIALTVDDWNKDGQFDRIDYATLGTGRHPPGSVTDFGMDGQPDIRVGPEGSKTEVWLQSEWRDLEVRENQPGVVESNEFRPVVLKDGRWIYVE